MSDKAANVASGLAFWGVMDKTVNVDYYFKEPKDILK
jgi:hypothetical protein